MLEHSKYKPMLAGIEMEDAKEIRNGVTKGSLASANPYFPLTISFDIRNSTSKF